MKQLLILSGKGGTGKTTVAGAFISLSKAKAYADCDVDAPNLHLISHWSSAPQRSDYFGMPKARINTAKCEALCLRGLRGLRGGLSGRRCFHGACHSGRTGTVQG